MKFDTKWATVRVTLPRCKLLANPYGKLGPLRDPRPAIEKNELQIDKEEWPRAPR